MAIFWYCCQCGFGPYNVALYSACINCNSISCKYCRREKHDDQLDPIPCSTMAPYPTPALSPASSPSLVLTLDNLAYSDQSTLPLPSSSSVMPTHTGRLLQDDTAVSLRSTSGIRMHGPTYYFICCNCGDGPKVYNHQARCVICHHVACENCTHLKP